MFVCTYKITSLFIKSFLIKLLHQTSMNIILISQTVLLNIVITLNYSVEAYYPARLIIKTRKEKMPKEKIQIWSKRRKRTPQMTESKEMKFQNTF